MNLWRIATATRRYAAEDLSGGGAAAYPGRWNDEGQPVVYAALSVSTAVLETAAHLKDAGLPLNRYLVRIEVPDAIWDAREETTSGQLPPTWDAIPAGHASVRHGSDWLRGQQGVILVLPSVIAPEDRIALINPLHPDSRLVSAHIQRKFDYNALFRPG